MELALHPLIAFLLISALIFGLALLWLESRHRLRPASPLQISTSGWKVQREGDSQVVVKGSIQIHNPHARMEVFVPEISLEPTLLGRGDLSALTITNIPMKSPGPMATGSLTS